MFPASCDLTETLCRCSSVTSEEQHVDAEVAVGSAVSFDLQWRKKILIQPFSGTDIFESEVQQN